MKTLVLTGLALGVLVVGGGGWAAWNATASVHHAPGGGPLQIDVVAPREPDLPDRAILMVGELRDGYVHDPERLRPPAVLDAEYAYVEAAEPEPEPLAEPPAERAGGLMWTSLRPAAPTRLEPNDYSFGFDQPLPEQPSGDGGRLSDPAASSPAADLSAWDERGLD